ncbi:penicillin-binding protein 1A [Arenibacter nanhaiticus]|uniref:Penicillin-binding protein 1A n=1 Tax=Arenibacter nanhaiticus TaxID=558155 RepID=A0A1M6A8U5_9FLAO|nr:transglycosylase domain-containing protein [Arenibacter nanhaiticus]SHI32533.1 penicillin-binding protein 1A [Arenibacter nanhaiticus]
MATESKKKKNTSFFKFIKWFWILFLTGVLSVVLIFFLASEGFFGEMPTFESLENPQTNLASEIISSDGETLGKYYLSDNRTPVDFEDLPENIIQALVATEDARYYQHSGIDAKGTLRAVVFMGSRGGASTISQQLARLLFVGVRSKNTFETIIQKIKEWVIAIRLERQYTKEEIIAMYLNTYDFNYSADGIRSAAKIYFGKEPQKLKIEESAVLVGMLKNSSYYNPRRREALVFNRRNTVLAQMAKYGYITQAEKDSLQALKMEINFNPESHSEGLATYFRMELKKFMKDWIDKNPKPALEGERNRYNINLDGLKIYTTIDSRMQRNAEEAVVAHMKRLQAEFFHQNTPDRNKTAPFIEENPGEADRIMERAIKNSPRWRIMKREGKPEKEIRESFYQPTPMTVFDWNSDSREKDTVMKPIDSIRYYKSFLRTAMMSMEPQTGHIKAWVGGVDYKHFQYDNVKQGARQVGSTFKPFVYAAAIDQLRLSPCDVLPDIHYCVEANKYGNPEPWCPKNSNGKYSGEMLTLKQALANSVNTITAQLTDKVGPTAVAAMSKNLGLTGNLPEVASIGLGTADLTVYEMVGAYGTFANQGVYVKPVMVTRIEDKNGTVLYEYVPETRDVLSSDVAYAMVDLMSGVTQGGSGTRLRTTGAEKYNRMYDEIITGYPYAFTNPIAGKTGTTQNQSDGWFMGMVPNLVTGVWVGGEDRATHFRTITYGQGASMALPIWGLYMKKNYANEEIGVSKEEFERPEELSLNVDCSDTESESDDLIDTDDDLDF